MTRAEHRAFAAVLLYNDAHIADIQAIGSDEAGAQHMRNYANRLRAHAEELVAPEPVESWWTLVLRTLGVTP